MVGPLGNSLMASGWINRGQGGSTPTPDELKDPNYLADDKQFATALAYNLRSLPPEAVRSIVETAKANVGNLTPEERAQVVASAATLFNPQSNNVADARQNVVTQTIERLANN
jgi:hypothetical protein